MQTAGIARTGVAEQLAGKDFSHRTFFDGKTGTLPRNIVGSIGVDVIIHNAAVGD